MDEYNEELSDEEVYLINSDELEPEEIFILGFLKGFDRSVMREWNERGLM